MKKRSNMVSEHEKKQKSCGNKASTRCGTLLHMAERRGGKKTDESRQTRSVEGMDRLIRRYTEPGRRRFGSV